MCTLFKIQCSSGYKTVNHFTNQIINSRIPQILQLDWLKCFDTFVPEIARTKKNGVKVILN